MFMKMVKEGVRANELTIVSTLSACAKIRALEVGKRIIIMFQIMGFS